MRTSRSLNRGIKAAAFATFAAIIPGRLDAQPAAPTAVQIESNDLGGVVTRRTARRRESGLSPRRPIFRPNSRKSSSPMTRAVIWYPICPKLIIRSGCAVMVSSTRRRSRPSPAKSST